MMDDVLEKKNDAEELTAQAWLARVAVAGPILEEAAPEGDRLQRLTDGAMAALLDQNLFRMLAPRVVGGAEMALPDFVAVVEALARHDGSAAWCVCQGNACAMLGAYLDPAVADAIWGHDPRGVLAWGPGKAEARAVDGGYSVTARSTFVSGSHHATWLAAHCTVVENDGSPRLDAGSVAENRSVLFPATAVRLDDAWNAIGLRGSGSDSFAIDDLFVPDEHTIVRSLMIDDKPRRSRLHGLPLLAIYATGFAATALGLARAFVDAFLDLAQEKRPRNATMVLRDNPAVQDEVARAEARIASARAFLLAEATRGWHELENSDTITIDQRMGIRLAGTHAIHEAKAAVDTLNDTAGTSAVLASGPFERRFRDIHTVALQIQGRKTQFQAVGAWMLGHPVNATNMSVI